MRFKRVYIVNFGHTTTPQSKKYPSSYRWATLKLAKRVEKVELRYKLDENFYEKVLSRRSIRIMGGREGVIWVIYEMK
jgi:hypothetical protein